MPISSTVARRLEQAEAALRPRWEARAMDVLGDAINAAAPETSRAIELRLRALCRQQTDDPAWHSDPVIAILCAVRDVAPEMAADVAARIGVELPEQGGESR